MKKDENPRRIELIKGQTFMFVSVRNRAAFLRTLIALLFTGAVFLAPGSIGKASAERVKIVRNSNIGKTVHTRKIRKTRKVVYSKTRRALQRTRINSLRRLPAPRHHAKTTTSRIRGSRGLNPRLRRLLAVVSRHYGRSLVITSGCRSARHNRRVGGARRSMHLHCKAADFKVPGISKASLRRYVSTLRGRGGVGTYCGRNIVHLDVGPRRSWYYGCHKRHHRKA